MENQLFANKKKTNTESVHRKSIVKFVVHTISLIEISELCRPDG